MIFQRFANLFKLLKCSRELLCHLCDRHRRTYAGNNVLALCVGQKFAHQFLFAGCRISGECYTGTAVVAHVTECHHLYVNGSTPGIRDIVVAAVYVCSGVVPGTEYGLDGTHQLFLRVGREVLADLFFVFCLKLSGKLFQVVCGQFNVLRNASLCLHFVDELLKVFLADFHNNVGIHLDKSAVAVPSPAVITGFLCDCVDNVLI